MNLMTLVIVLVAFIAGVATGFGGSLYYMKWKTQKALSNTEDLMQNAFEDLPNE